MQRKEPSGGSVYRGCLFCKGGLEKKVVRTLAILYPELHAIAPERMRIRREQGKVIEERVILLPGYVFFESMEPELSMNLSRQENVLRLLTYPDGDWHLRGYDDQGGLRKSAPAAAGNGGLRLFPCGRGQSCAERCARHQSAAQARLQTQTARA